MKICENGVIRDMTLEEEAELLNIKEGDESEILQPIQL